MMAGGTSHAAEYPRRRCDILMRHTDQTVETFVIEFHKHILLTLTRLLQRLGLPA